MPVFNSDQYAIHVANPPQLNSVNLWGARVRMRYGLFGGAVGFAQNDIVLWFPIYPGERPMFWQLRSEANTALLTMSVGLYDSAGTAITAAKYLAATAINATPVNALAPSLLHAAETVGGVVGGLIEGANPSDTADIELIMFYVRD